MPQAKVSTCVCAAGCTFLHHCHRHEKNILCVAYCSKGNERHLRLALTQPSTWCKVQLLPIGISQPLGPREKSSACREVALSLSTPPPGLGKLGRETAFLATSLSSPFNYSGTGWRRWGCRKANCWEGWGGEPNAFPPTGPTTSLCTLPCSAELAGLSFPEFQMTAALVGSNLAI